MNDLFKRASNFISQQKRNKLRCRLLSVMGVIVVFITTYMLILPGITMERKTICDMEEHEHTEECYAYNTALVCGLEENEEHAHSEECYETNEELICGLEEHTHTDECYEEDIEFVSDEETETETEAVTEAVTEEEKLTVPEEETEEETLPESGFFYYREEKTAPKDDAVSGGAADSNDAKYEENTVPDDVTSGSGIGIDTTVETHSEDYVENYTETTTEDVNGLDEQIEMLKIQDIPLCGLPQHKHSALCYNEDGQLICELEEHEHDSSCYSIMLLDLYAAEGESIIIFEGNGYKLTLNSNGGYTLTYDGANIPDGFISSEELNPYVSNITNIIIKESVSEIGSDAFVGIQNLEAVELEENVSIKSIGERAFKNCKKLKAINLENLKNLEDIHDEAFANTGIKKITIPVVEKIWANAFKDCTDLVNVHFEPNTEDKYGERTIGECAFENCTALENINLKDFNSSDKVNLSEGVFKGCTALKGIEMPENLDGIMENMFLGCTSLEKVLFNRSDNEITHWADFIKGTKVKDIDISMLKIGNGTPLSFMKDCESIVNVTLPDVGYINSHSFENCAHLMSVKINSAAPRLERIDEYAFKGSPMLSDFDLSKFKKLTYIAQNALEGCLFIEKLDILPQITGIGPSGLKDCINLSEINIMLPGRLYDHSFYDDTFTGAGMYDVSFSEYDYTEENIDDLYSNMGDVEWEIDANAMRILLKHAKGLSFDSNISFTVGKDGVFTGAAAPFITGGTYFTDNGGNLYRKINDASAELVYAAREPSNINIPSEVTYTFKTLKPNPLRVDSDDPVTLSVTRVCRDAFKGCNVESITINAKKITSVEDYAFANAEKLKSINDKTSVTEALKLFANKGDNVFFNTALTATPEQKEEKKFSNPEAKADNNGISIKGGDNNSVDALSMGLQKTDQIEGQDGKYLTGKAANIRVSVSNVNDGAYYRVYIRKEEGCDISISNVSEYDDFVLYPTDDPDIFYYEFQANSVGQAINTSITLAYPNYSAPGSSAQIWGVKVPGDKKAEYDNKVIEPADTNTDVTASENYFDLEWLTAPKEFELSKTILEEDKLGFTASADGKGVLQGLKYTIGYTAPEGGTEGNFGSDVVKYVEFSDKLTLPDKISWRRLNTDNTRFDPITGGGDLYAYGTDNKEYLVCSISGFGQISDIHIEKNEEDNTYTLHWRLLNTSTSSEIQSVNGVLAFGNDVLTAESLTENGKIENIHNDITADTYYTFSEKKQDTANADVSANTGEGKITLDKQLINDAQYMNEDVSYKITIKNPSAFSYNNIGKLEDDLSVDRSNIQYIKPENMQELFDGIDGNYLTITISDAMLTTPFTERTATAVDGRDTVKLSPSNTGATEVKDMYDDVVTVNRDRSQTHTLMDTNLITEKATITLKKVEGSIVITADYTDREGNSQNTSITVGSHGIADIRSALDSLAYIVTNPDKYKLTWDYPAGFELKAGETREYDINATLKNSLMYLPDGDHLYYLGWNNSPPIDYSNTATVYSSENDIIKTANTSEEKTETRYDLNIGKAGYIDGVNINEKDENGKNIHELQFGDVIDYEVRLDHYGNGSYDVLPIVDCMSGPQALLAPVKENSKADWAAGLKTYKDNGVEYYVLSEPKTYKGVYISGYYADSVTVENKADSLKTVIKYYIKDTLGGDCCYMFRYKSIISPDLAGVEVNGSFSIDNKVWANDYATHRIEAPLIVGGARVSFEKKIVLEKSSDPAFDELDSDDYTALKREANAVTYRLMLDNPYTDDPASINGMDMYDMLPRTGGGFKWVLGENVTIDSYVKSTEGVNITLDGVDFTSHSTECEIQNDRPGTIEVEDDGDQQYIVWNNNFNITLPPKSQLYIYVTLKFPEDEETWNKYSEAVKDNPTLLNTFYVYSLPDTVKHSLANPAKILLQKGVYEVGHYTINDYWKTLQSYYMDSDRYHYNNNDENVGDSKIRNVVTYYVIIRNTGSSRVYLSDIYDVLPEGYEYMAFKVAAVKDKADGWYHVGNATIDKVEKGSLSQFGGMSTMLARPSEYPSDGDWRESNFKYCEILYKGTEKTSDGKNRLKFYFNTKHNYNDNNFAEGWEKHPLECNEDEVYYLNPGEWTQFGYTVYTGNADIDTAVNTVAMEYIDPDNTNMPVEADTESVVTASNVNGKQPNDGTRELWDDQRAAAAGFTEHWNDNKNTNRQWLVSRVSLTKGEHVPGITKTVDSPIAKAGESVNWTVTAHNNGTGELNGYTLEDTVESPFRFNGNISYCVFAPVNGLNHSQNTNQQSKGTRDNGDGILFSIKRDTDNKAHIVPNTIDSDETGTELTVNGAPVTVNVRNLDVNSNTYYFSNINVSISRDVKGNETLKVQFPDRNWSIPAGGHSELKLSTDNTDPKQDGTFVNNVSLLPDDKNYNANRVTQGKNITDDDGNNLGVKNAAAVSIYNGAPTGAVKLIEEVGDPENNAQSDHFDDNFIYIDDKSKEFRYTLQVQNMNNDPMTELVFMDNLPQIGDSNTVRKELSRDSEFEVSLADEPSFTVNIITREGAGEPTKNILDPKNYTITYSSKNGDFTKEDWEGTGWSNDKTNARSFRLEIKDNNGEDLIPANSTIQVSFNARITGDAKPSQIAWNSFAYSYEVNGLKATAAPLNVGVRIPSAPQLRKSIVNKKGSLSASDEEKTYRFVIYRSTNGQVNFSDFSELTISNTLGSSWQFVPDWTVITLKVPRNATASEVFYLADNSVNKWHNKGYDHGGFEEDTGQKWKWIEGATYYAVEVDDGDNYSFYSISGLPDRQYSFVYNKDKNEEITFANAKPDWRIDVLKVDKDDNNHLHGALFGLYSPNESDKMTSKEMEALGIDEKRFAMVEYNGKKYYLSDTMETPENGIARFTGVCEDEYVILEIKAPNGYYGDTELKHITRNAEDPNYIATLTVTNEKGVPLPETGGYGIADALKLFALLLISISAVSFVFRYVRRNI